MSSNIRSEFPDVGKISADFFEHVILKRLGAPDPTVIVGPTNGVDVGVVELPGDQVLVLTTDPFFIVPAYGWRRAAWFAVHILASDAATSGLPPRYIAIDLNLPMSMTAEEFTQMWDAVHETCRELGIAVVTGHTGRYHGCDYPMVGGATVCCVGPKDSYVTPRDARIGDQVIITKGAGIEATGLLAVTFPKRVEQAFGPDFARRAQEVFWQMSTVKDARVAIGVGVGDLGVTAMHDATECGVLGGVYELAQAAGKGVRLDLEAVPLPETSRRVCELFGIDPYSSISEGTLIITCRPFKAKEVVARLADEGIPAALVGEIVDPSEGMVVTRNGRTEKLSHPRVDPFWQAFARAASEGT